LAPSGTCHPPGCLEASSAWRQVSPARRFCCCNIGLLKLNAWSTRLFVMLQGGIIGFLELWLRTYPLSCGSR